VTRLQLAWRLFLIRREIRAYYDALVDKFKSVKYVVSVGDCTVAERRQNGPALGRQDCVAEAHQNPH
jgi:hypothetical protein